MKLGYSSLTAGQGRCGRDLLVACSRRLSAKISKLDTGNRLLGFVFFFFGGVVTGAEVHCLTAEVPVCAGVKCVRGSGQ